MPLWFNEEPHCLIEEWIALNIWFAYFSLVGSWESDGADIGDNAPAIATRAARWRIQHIKENMIL
jgi:hypothetical protein